MHFIFSFLHIFLSVFCCQQALLKIGWTSTQLTCVLCKNDKKTDQKQVLGCDFIFVGLFSTQKISHMDHFTGQQKLF